MSKRKTRQEKIIAHLKRQVSENIPQKSDHINPSVNSFKNNFSPLPSSTVAIDYRYFKADLLKTFLVTGFILTIELILFVLMKR